VFCVGHAVTESLIGGVGDKVAEGVQLYVPEIPLQSTVNEGVANNSVQVDGQIKLLSAVAVKVGTGLTLTFNVKGFPTQTNPGAVPKEGVTIYLNVSQLVEFTFCNV
jgi:hypothetical protein